MHGVKRFLRISRSAMKLLKSNIMKTDILDNELYDDIDTLDDEIQHYYEEQWDIEDFVMSEVNQAGKWLYQIADGSDFVNNSLPLNIIIKLVEKNIDKLIQASHYFTKNNKIINHTIC